VAASVLLPRRLPLEKKLRATKDRSRRQIGRTPHCLRVDHLTERPKGRTPHATPLLLLTVMQEM